MKKNFFVWRSFAGVVDSYFLPGTTCGLEIAWLYVNQWKDKSLIFILAITYLATSLIDATSQKEKYNRSGHSHIESNL